jgi:2-desacetyl-2-hydroxyethyl bacteriochlorophyllide A dehydrogenase
LRSWVISFGSRIINWFFPGQGRRIAYKVALAFITRLRAVFKRRGIVQGTAVIWPRPGHVVTEPFEWIRPSEGQILVENDFTVVSSGTERAMFRGLPNTQVYYPSYPGYSGAGKVVDIGSKKSKYEIGDRVAGPMPHASLATVNEYEVFPIPDNVSSEVASFNQLAIIALQGLRKVQPLLGKSIAVVGQGIIGQLVTHFAYLSGAYRIVAIAHSTDKFRFSRESGATETITAESASTQIEKLNLDIVIEATGHSSAIAQSMNYVKPEGKTVLLGSPRGLTEIDLAGLMSEKSIEIIGAHIRNIHESESSNNSWDYRREGEAFFSLIASGNLQVEHLISERLNPAEAAWFFKRLARLNGKEKLATLFDWNKLSRNQRFKLRSLFSLPHELGTRNQLFIQNIDPRPEYCWNLHPDK